MLPRQSPYGYDIFAGGGVRSSKIRANVQGFPGFKNHNSFFERRSTIEIMANGNMISFYDTFKRIEKLQAC